MINKNWILGGLAAFLLLSKKEENAIGAIVSDKCVGVTECADGTWSTLPIGRRGVCNRHGGPKNGYRKRVQKKETSEIVDIIEVVDDNNEVVDVVEVPTQGVYFYTTYTTKKNKTLDVIAIEFGSIPPSDTLATLRNSRFWYNRKNKTWYGKTNNENQNIVDSLPLVLKADIIEQTIPIVTETEVQQYIEESPKKYQIGDIVLVKHSDSFLPATIKKIGTKYYYFTKGYFEKRTINELYPIDHGTKERLEELKTNIKNKSSDDYYKTYYSIANPEIFGEHAYSHNWFGNLKPYEGNRGTELLHHDLVTVLGKNRKEWFLENFPKPETQAAPLSIQPKRGKIYSQDDWSKLVSSLFKVDYTDYPEVKALFTKSKQVEDKLRKKVNPKTFYWIMTKNDPNKKTSNFSGWRNGGKGLYHTPSGMLAARWENWFKAILRPFNEWYNVKGSIDFSIRENRTEENFLFAKGLIIEKVKSEMKKYYSYFSHEYIFNFHMSPLVIAENTPYTLKSALFEQIFSLYMNSQHSARRCTWGQNESHKSVTHLEGEDLKKFFICLLGDIHRDERKIALQEGFKAVLYDTPMSHTFDKYGCFSSLFDIDTCMSGPYGFAQLNQKRWSFIYLIEDTLKKGENLSNKALEDYKLLLTTVRGHERPYNIQYHRTEKENLDLRDFAQYILDSLGNTNIQVTQGYKNSNLQFRFREGNYDVSKAQLPEVLAPYVKDVEQLKKTAQALKRNWGKNTTLLRQQEDGTHISSTFRVGDFINYKIKGVMQPFLITNTAKDGLIGLTIDELRETTIKPHKVIESNLYHKGIAGIKRPKYLCL